MAFTQEALADTKVVAERLEQISPEGRLYIAGAVDAMLAVAQAASTKTQREQGKEVLA